MPQLIYFVVMMVLSYALQPKPQKPKAAAFDDFDFPTADDGTPQIVVFGDVWLTDWTVIGVGNYRNKAIRKSTGGIFSKSVTTGHKYAMTIHMGICRGLDTVQEIRIADKRAWVSDSDELPPSQSIYLELPGLFGGDDGEGGIVGGLNILLGDSNQDTTPALTKIYGNLSPAYRGVVTFVYDGFICSNSPYPKPWSFRVRRIISNWDGAVWYQAKAVIWLNDNKIKAMNPAHIIYEAQTNRVWGRGFVESQLDLASFQTAADQLYDEGFGLCMAWRRQESLSEFIQQIIDTIGAAFFIDRLTGLWKLILIRENYDIETLPVYDSTCGLLSITDDNNTVNDIASNQTFVTYRNPVSNKDQTIRAENVAAIQKYGVISENKTYAGIPTETLAGRVAARDMKISQSCLKKFKLVFDRRAYRMQPMSVFKISASDRGINSLILRAIRVEHDNITNGQITVTAIQDVFGLPASNYIREQPNLWQTPNHVAMPVAQQKIYEIPYLELLTEIPSAQFSNKAFAAVIAEKPTVLSLNYEIISKLSSENSFNIENLGNFGYVSEISQAVQQSAAITTCVLADPFENSLQIGDKAFLDDEIVLIESIDSELNEITFRRGCIDTVPAPHAIGSKIWIYSFPFNPLNRYFGISQAVEVKLLTRTSSEKLPPNLAPSLNLQLVNRAARPYPPAHLKLNNISYPASLNNPLTFIEWSERNRITQDQAILDQLAASVAPEKNTTYTLRIFKKTALDSSFTLVSDQQGLTQTKAMQGQTISPALNDFFVQHSSIGRLTAINAPYQASATTQKFVLARAKVGETYGLVLNPNLHGAQGFANKVVEEEFLATDTSISFLNRLKAKILNTLSSADKKALRFGMMHSLTGGYRCEGISGRVLEISHSSIDQAPGNIIHFVLYDVDNTVLHHHQFAFAKIDKFYFDPNLERCWLWFEYDGSLDLNNSVETNNPHLRTFAFDDVSSLGISFTRAPIAQANFIADSNFCFNNGYLWCARPSETSSTPIILTRLNLETLETLVSVNYTNPVVSGSVAISEIGSIILTNAYLFYAFDTYYDGLRLPRGITKFDITTGAVISYVAHEPEATSIEDAYLGMNGPVGKYFTSYNYIEASAFGLSVTMNTTEATIFKNSLQIRGYDYTTGFLNQTSDVAINNTVSQVSNAVKYNSPSFAVSFINALTGKFQFVSIAYKENHPVSVYGHAWFGGSTILNMLDWTQVDYAEAVLVKSAVVSASTEDNVAGFHDAASLEIKFDICGEFAFITTSSVEPGSSSDDVALFPDISDAVAVRVELWSVRDGLESWQKQIIEVPVNL